MKQNKRILLIGALVILLAAFLGGYQLPYYIYKPGSADALNPIVEVEGGYESEGDMHLVTVRGGQATPIMIAFAYFMPYQEIYPIDQIVPEGYSENEYMEAQLHLMETSQEAAKVVAYEEADAKVDVTFEGVYVMSVLENMPASGELKMGDRIVEVDGQPVEEAKDLTDYVTGMSAGDSVEIVINRGDEQLSKTIELAPFENASDRVGMGISLVTDRNVTVSPKVNIKSGEIGGPSAGLMFSLEMYDQLTEVDLTKGYQVAGTGEVNYEGEVGRIGGIDKKVVAADESGADIFFAPNENGKEGSNYEIAKQTAEKIGTDMEVVPVDTFKDALLFLESKEPKS
ncbi:hypothetical protein N781_12795 [Pontibacillus halophilus JSM 076056 = DSM 19796]|uniref:endopeptidase La n=1 Tax=Pontibacillus halophilus JSM 076056 = DSM 19796 TaxID=1385510 RepID=A0A0A5GMQ2_9BACI|nr:SepM family pheromone-processing serine protease [Pontibacillus halophilus]KGX93279.1 hypothetical protein N781_12795 [Pontibacillus halophilus JSM 076056 = DSM 19796]